jgi:hypothetical protein
VSTVAMPTTGPLALTARAQGTGTAPLYWRRRAVAVLALVLVAFLLTVAIGRVGAEAELADRVAGHVVVEPGQTLWEVAVATAPDGVDARLYLAEIQALNGLGTDVDAWTVVLLPAR